MYQTPARLIFPVVQAVSVPIPGPTGPRRPNRLPTVALWLLALLPVAACARHAPRHAVTTTGHDGHPGIPGDATLTRSGSIEVHRDGTVVSDRDVHGTIHVHANDVTITRTRVTSSDYWPIWLDATNTGLTVTDSEIAGSGSCQAGIGTHDYTAVRIDIHGCGDGAKAGRDTVIEASRIHDLLVTPGSHNDGIQVSEGDHILIRGNTILAPHGQTSAIMIGPDWDVPVRDVRIEDNWLDGGTYTLQLDAADAVVRGNRFGGHATEGAVNLTTPPVVWSDNTRAADGRPVLP